MTIETILREGGCGRICADLLAGLGDWFGIPESNAAYTADAETKPTWLALKDGEPIGLMILKPHAVGALEIHFIAARRDLRRHGAGSALVAAAEREARKAGAPVLTVKTLGPSEDYAPYEETRAFYRALGFVALEEFTEIWGPENPTLFMAKWLGQASNGSSAWNASS